MRFRVSRIIVMDFWKSYCGNDGKKLQKYGRVFKMPEDREYYAGIH